MMTDIFELILNLSLMATPVILLLIAARLPLNRISKKYSYRLWVLAAFKLVCPVSLWSVVTRLFDNMSYSSGSVADKVAVNAVKATSAAKDTAVEIIAPVNMQEMHTEAVQTAVQSSNNLTIGADIAKVLTAIWIAGAVILLLITVIKAVKTAHGLRGAEHVSGNIYCSYKVSSPFVFGIIRPRIYMPKDLPEEDYSFLLSHEQTHIRRHDLIYKVIWISLLSVHWFNPLVWIAYRLFERDMEMSCDEEVIKRIDKESRADYCSSLVNFARLSNQPMSVIMPVNFGKNDVKARIESIMKYRKLTKKASAAAILTFALAATGCIFSPDKKELKVNLPTSETTAETTAAETTVETTAETTAAETTVETTAAETAAETTVETTANKETEKEAEKDPTPAAELMGYKEWRCEKSNVSWADEYHEYKFYAADGTLLGYYGGTKDNNYAIKDLDGDGVTELICNTEYSGDGAQRFVVYRNNNGKIESAEDDWDYLGKLFGREIEMVGEIETAYDFNTGKLMAYDKKNDYKAYEYEYSGLVFQTFTDEN